MYFKKITVLCIALAMLACASYAVADDAEKSDGLARVAKITAKDGHEKALVDAITEYHHFMGDKEGAMRYSWFSIETGPDTGKFIARSGDHNWADFDAEHDWDEESNAKFESLVAPHIKHADVSITKWDDELGMWPESMEGYKYFSVTRWHIIPGKGKVFNDSLKKIDEALKANGFPTYYGFVRAVSGGMGNTVTLVVPRKSFADMAPKEPSFNDIMNKVMGEDEASAFLAEWGSTFKGGQNMLLKYMPGASDYGDSE